jgi:hypothetical protein
MGFTFTINGSVFADMAQAEGSFAKAFNVSSVAGFVRYHVPGTSGTLLTRMGRLGYNIQVRCQVVGGSPAAATASYEAYLEAWTNASISIVAPSGKTYPRCMLEPDGMNMIVQTRATGCAAGQAFLEFDARFTCDTGTNS